MRRLARHLFTLCSAVSLLLCAHAILGATLYGERYLLGYTFFQPLEPPRRFTAAETDAYRPPPPEFDFAGFRIQRGFRAQYTIQHGRVYLIPYWFLALLYAVLPLLWLRTRRREWRAAREVRLWQAGVCPACGYDLRASPERCPECGTVPRLP